MSRTKHKSRSRDREKRSSNSREKNRRENRKEKRRSSSPGKKCKIYLRGIDEKVTEKMIRSELEVHAKILEVKYHQRGSEGKLMALVYIQGGLKEGEKIKESLKQKFNWHV
mmetsp:Transcript_37914/g.36323  ORF Transcript_37914/g.36323 Transcript_37914/m.36323 type:complete len:111 (+) Transcript_37914:50-382(+)